jgi:hypothetical protein
MSDVAPEEHRGKSHTKLGWIFVLFCVGYPLSIGPVWRVLEAFRQVGWISNEVALGLGFIPYIPLLACCRFVPMLEPLVQAYLATFGLRFTHFIPG